MWNGIYAFRKVFIVEHITLSMAQPRKISISSFEEKSDKGLLKRLPQRGKPSLKMFDEARPARPPGKRISKAGNVYWETRPNRSDVDRRKML